MHSPVRPTRTARSIPPALPAASRPVAARLAAGLTAIALTGPAPAAPTADSAARRRHGRRLRQGQALRRRRTPRPLARGRHALHAQGRRQGRRACATTSRSPGRPRRRVRHALVAQRQEARPRPDRAARSRARGWQTVTLRLQGQAHRGHPLRRLRAHRATRASTPPPRAASTRPTPTPSCACPVAATAGRRLRQQGAVPEQRGPRRRQLLGRRPLQVPAAPGPPRTRRRPRRPPPRRPAAGPAPTTPAYRPARRSTPYTGPCTITSPAHHLRLPTSLASAATRWSSTPRASSSRSPWCRACGRSTATATAR